MRHTQYSPRRIFALPKPLITYWETDVDAEGWRLSWLVTEGVGYSAIGRNMA
jgi:hypothetical protein